MFYSKLYWAVDATKERVVISVDNTTVLQENEGRPAVRIESKKSSLQSSIEQWHLTSRTVPRFFKVCFRSADSLGFVYVCWSRWEPSPSGDEDPKLSAILAAKTSLLTWVYGLSTLASQNLLAYVSSFSLPQRYDNCHKCIIIPRFYTFLQ